MFFRNFWKSLVWALLILYICIMPAREIPEVGIINADKAVHSVVYGILGLLLIPGLLKQTTFQSLRCFACSWSFVLCSFYGGILELMQHFFILDRTGDWFDFIANALGAFLVSAFAAVKYRSL